MRAIKYAMEFTRHVSLISIHVFCAFKKYLSPIFSIPIWSIAFDSACSMAATVDVPAWCNKRVSFKTIKNKNGRMNLFIPGSAVWTNPLPLRTKYFVLILCIDKEAKQQARGTKNRDSLGFLEQKRNILVHFLLLKNWKKKLEKNTVSLFCRETIGQSLLGLRNRLGLFKDTVFYLSPFLLKRFDSDLLEREKILSHLNNTEIVLTVSTWK